MPETPGTIGKRYKLPEEATLPGSKLFSLDLADIEKLIKSLALTVGGAALIGAGGALAAWCDALPASQDWGAYGVVVGVLAPFVANAIRKLLVSNGGST